MRPHPLLLCLPLLYAGCDLLFNKLEPRHFGESCVAQGDCATGLVCARDLICRASGDPGTAIAGADCIVSAECGLGLACSSAGTCTAEGEPGTAAHGEDCADARDCRAGLYCHAQRCAGLEVPMWLGAECPEPELETGPFRVYFEVPEDEPLVDFYRLPYPNDARVRPDGTINLDGHPGPGALIPAAGDVVGGMLRAAAVDVDGFGPNQAVFLRFSETPDKETLSIGLPGQGTVAVVDLTQNTETYGQLVPFRYELSGERTSYICHNWLAASPNDGSPWLPGHTYALFITRGVTDIDGNVITQDPDFRAAIAAARPPDDRLAITWSSYAPLRLWLQGTGLSPDQLAGGTVFTLQDPVAEVEHLREAVAAEPVPTLNELSLCGVDPDRFADPADPTRGCQTNTADAWLEVQATVTLPQYQVGNPPFKDAVDGGGIDLSQRIVVPTRSEDVHISLSVPKGIPMPEEGWPVILYGHGTGGSYTSAVREGLVAELSQVTLEDGSVQPFMLLGFDAPLHGPRAHPEAQKQAWLDLDPEAYAPDVLFFNPLNARAARDNALQEVVDLWSLVKLLRTFDLPEWSSPTDERIKVDPEQIYYLGHSQGAVVGATFLAHEAHVQAAVLSGGGGLTIGSLLNKRSPHDLPAMIAAGLADPQLSRTHPLLNIAQQIAERSDGVNHARSVLQDPVEGDRARHILQIYGVGDSYSPDVTQFSLARALGLSQVPGASSPLLFLNTTTLPASGNLNGVTGVVMLYENQGEDAHFVLFDRADTMHHVRTFFATAVRDGVPTVLPL
jgi:hypothetical protein